MSSVARAAVLVAPRTYQVREFPMPTPASGCLVVKNLLSGICGTDKHTFEGYTTQYSGTSNPSSTPFPIIQGHENVGEIVQVEGDVFDFEGVALKAGDRVVVGPNVTCGRCHACTHGLPYTLCSDIRDYGNTMSASEAPHLFGGWAEYMYVLPSSYIFRVPEDLPTEIAVLAELFAVTVGLDRAQSLGDFPSGGLRFGHSVLVYGVGPLGLCHVAKARMLGADKIIAIDLSPTRLAFAKRMGADVTLNANDLTGPELLTSVRDLTGGLGADVVVECVGRPEVIPAAIDMLRVGGTFIEVGNFSDLGDVPINPNRHLCSKGITLIGIPGQEPGAYAPGLRAMRRYQDQMPFDEFVSHRYGLQSAAEAVVRSISPDSLKVVIDPWLHS
jgi:threonine dehydrogenase-like Zn-dependent dehydrogenase